MEEETEADRLVRVAEELYSVLLPTKKGPLECVLFARLGDGPYLLRSAQDARRKWQREVLIMEAEFDRVFAEVSALVDHFSPPKDGELSNAAMVPQG